MGGIIELEHVDWVGEVFQLGDEADRWAQFFFAWFFCQNEHSEYFLFVKLHLYLSEVQVSRSVEELLGNYWFLGGKVALYLESICVGLGNRGNFYFWVEDVDGGVDGGYSAEGLGDVSDSAVDIEIGYFSIDSTRFDEFPEFFDKAFECVCFSGVLGNGFFIVILVIADDVAEEGQYFFIFFH